MRVIRGVLLGQSPLQVSFGAVEIMSRPWGKGGRGGLVPQWGRASPGQWGKEKGQGIQRGPWTGNQVIPGSGCLVWSKMGILVGRGTQGDGSRAPTGIYRLGPVVWCSGAASVVPELGSSEQGPAPPCASLSPSQVKPAKTVNNQNKTVL